LMKFGDVLLAISNRRRRDSFCNRRAGIDRRDAAQFKPIEGLCNAYSGTAILLYLQQNCNSSLLRLPCPDDSGFHKIVPIRF
jgi:hypothetical protein